MESPDDYRRYAAQCVAMAQRTDDAKDKARLVEMAQTWLALAGKIQKTKDPKP